MATSSKPSKAPWWYSACLAVLLLSLLAPQTAADTDANANADANANEANFGFAGNVKLGHWVPIKFSGIWVGDADSYAIKTIDGDESPVTYAGQLNEQNTAYVRFGKTFGSVGFQFLKDGKIVSEYQKDKSDLDNLIFSKSTALLTVVIGESSLCPRIKSAIAADSADDETLTVEVSSVSGLPTEAIGWQSVNRLIISSASVENFSEAKPEFFDALNDWVKAGGDLLIIGDPSRPDLFAAQGPFASLVPGKVLGAVQMDNSRDLERFVSTGRRQLIGRDGQPLPMLELNPSDSAMVVATAGDYPILARSAHGFGRISFCALDLAGGRLMQWPSHTELVEKVIATNDQRRSKIARQEFQRSKRGLTHSGYTDMLGQLRVPLDDFSTVRFLPFTLVAVLITFYILCVAVGDYFLLNNVLKKMELTWITFPLMALLFCGLAIVISKSTRPSSLQINQMEIVDFDLVDGASRGTAWVNLYAPAGEKVNIDLDSETSFGLDIGQQMVSWQGLPGDGLGGMENAVSTSFKQLQYQQTISVQDGSPNVSMEGLPLQVASTKPLLIKYEITTPTSFSSQLSDSRDRLEGTFKNPLSVPIYNGKIFFGEYVYLLKKPLRPDVVTLIESDAKEKTLRSYLNRRSAKGKDGNDAGRSQNRPWDPNEKSLTRIADVMMFYEAAGGQGYTGLTNGFHREIDFSRLLRLGQAILVGQTETGSRIKINGQDVSNSYDSNITMVRLALPVTDR